MSRLFLVALVLLALAAPGLAQDSLNCRQLALWPEFPELDAEAWSIALDPVRNLAFLGTYLHDDSIWENWTFCILDISNLSLPRLLSVNIVPDQGDSYDVHHNSNRLYLGTEGDGFAIWDVSDPTAPESLGVFDVRYAAFRIMVAGDYAYIAALEHGLRVVDVSDPRNPVEVGHCAVDFAWDVAVAGEMAYVVDYAYGLWLVNISDPTNPYTVGSCPIDGHHFDVAVADGYAYLPGQIYNPEPATGYINVIDVSDPEEPVLAATDTVGRVCYGLAVSDGFLYVAAGSYGLVVYDIGDPRSPVRVGHYQKTGHRSFTAMQPAVVGNVAFVADFYGGLRIIEFLGAGVEEPPDERPQFSGRGPTVVRGSLSLTDLGHDPGSENRSGSCPAFLLDATGRKVMELQPGDNDVRHLAPGVYFVRTALWERSPDRDFVRKVVIQP